MYAFHLNRHNGKPNISKVARIEGNTVYVDFVTGGQWTMDKRKVIEFLPEHLTTDEEIKEYLVDKYPAEFV